MSKKIKEYFDEVSVKTGRKREIATSKEIANVIGVVPLWAREWARANNVTMIGHAFAWTLSEALAFSTEVDSILGPDGL